MVRIHPESQFIAPFFFTFRLSSIFTTTMMRETPNSNDENLTTYQLAIEKLAKLKSEEIFSNEGPEHAAFVMGNIFINAQSKVRIFAGDFNGDVSNNAYYIDGLQKFLNKNCSNLTVIFEKSPNTNSTAYKILTSPKFHKKVELRILGNEIDSKAPFHFAVGDSNMFRIETDTEKYTAICSFNNQENSEKLIKHFDEFLLDKSSIIAKQTTN